MKSPLRDTDPDFGLLAWLEKTRVALPLKGVECRFNVAGAVASVELDQIYHQNAERPLDCTYTFPLPAGAAVYRCELHVNGRVVRAKVEDRESAQRIYQQQKLAGRRTAMVETERANLFTLSLGNMQPGDVLVLRLAWFQALDRGPDGLRLIVPTCPGVRYIPGRSLLRESSGRGMADDTDQVPDASRLTPPRIDGLHPDAAYFAMSGRLSAADVDVAAVSSPSHPVYIREAEATLTVELAGRDAVPDRDFVLTWRETAATELAPRAWGWSDRGEHYALVELRAPELVAPPQGFSQDFYFLVDRSGSMQGAKWQKTCEALRSFVDLLGAHDHVFITVFSSDFRDFAEAPVVAPAVAADRGFQRMEALGTDGGTELLPAARHLLQQVGAHSRGRHASVVLITDGQVGNEEAVLTEFRQAPQLIVHAFGIDTAVNDAFLRELAEQHRGGCWLRTPDDDIRGCIVALGERLRLPVLTDLRVSGTWESGQPVLPDVHAREVVTIALHAGTTSPIAITGRLADGREHRITLGPELPGNEAVRLLWAKQRIAALVRSGHGREAVALAKRHNVICEGAAFIAWDDAEQVAVAQSEIVQPSMETAYVGAQVFYSLASVAEPREPRLAESILRRMPSPTPDTELIARNSAVVRAVLQRLQAPERLIDGFISWAHSVERVEALERAANALAELRKVSSSSAMRAELERWSSRALESSPEALLEWAREVAPPLRHLLALIEGLRSAGAPNSVIDHVGEWIFRDGRIDAERLQRLATFVRSLKTAPFSAAASARSWRAFLEATNCELSRSGASIGSWIAELETY